MTLENSPSKTDVDVVVVGAGIAGMYAVHRFRGDGLSVQGFESASDVGGTWFHNRYPGARCDVESVDYSYSFSDELQQEWDWSERYATQPEILAYLNHVADRFDLRRSFTFNTRVSAAHFDEDTGVWTVTTDSGTITSKYCVFATGALSVANYPAIPGREEFAGRVLHTAQWPHEGVDFTGLRVGVIGTGSSGIQLVPEVARQAESVTVFQRTPNYSIPAANRPLSDEERREQKATYDERRRKSRLSGGGSPFVPHEKNTLEVDEAERERVYEHYWNLGGVLFSKAFPDQLRNEDANQLAKEFAERKIRSVIEDPAVADDLIPTDHPIGTKRIVTDSGYFQTYNSDHVKLVNLRRTPIQRITADGVEIAGPDGPELHELDVLIFATGFDAVTGALGAMDIRGRDGRDLAGAWADGVSSYLGLMVAGFPNMFLVNGPGSPGVLANMVLTSEDHVDWISDTIAHLDSAGLRSIEPVEQAQQGWMAECARLADQTLFTKADSWYVGANIPGKPRVFMMYPGGFGNYRAATKEITDAGYEGFALR
ncbi:NAD(P)/FAD-dependent oxidoreductase [Dietzia sp. ANT_WB102]|uniref:flavin-containing monooxygenase n=1 Tax=Dietzia sp. ANT_WB102 TaxID=2597345 RepID=UPI0011EDBF20|nr:NAD(P)/FAD-dependent oxidoreductase [Dietzia sp. ANT_WB102]KAA0918026.1 NAD(P)/FAD-dependent oxidoreductase [Dietzia sp. ANT_WB102]